MIIDLDFTILLEDGSPSSSAYEIMVEKMPKMIVSYRTNGQSQMANWLENAMNQINSTKQMSIDDGQYFFMIQYSDLAAGFTPYTKAQILKCFIP